MWPPLNTSPPALVHQESLLDICMLHHPRTLSAETRVATPKAARWSSTPPPTLAATTGLMSLLRLQQERRNRSQPPRCGSTMVLAGSQVESGFTAVVSGTQTAIE